MTRLASIGAMALLTASALGAGTARASAGVIPLPPFNYCPAVGASPSCQVLLDINPDGTISVYSDSAVGNYDGADDTLVGIRNDSGQPAPAITVTGPGSGLGGLDGDGLCSYSVAGCPFGPTGYEGPGTAIVTDPANLDHTEVDFAAAGLAPGAATYFSLEGNLSTAVLTARQGHLATTYTSLGDSYSSGESVSPYYQDSDKAGDVCHRSPQAYGPLLNLDKNLGGVTFVACSGALTSNLVGPNAKNNEPAQISPTNLSDSTRTVTLTIGGNDIGFAEIAKACTQASAGQGSGRGGCLDSTQLRSKVLNRIRTFGGFGGGATTADGSAITPLPDVLHAIHAAAKNAKIYIAGYPELFGSDVRYFPRYAGIGGRQCKVASIGGQLAEVYVGYSDALQLNLLAASLDSTIAFDAAQARSASLPVTYVNALSAFKGHGLCDSGSSWINGVILDSQHNPLASSYHPTSQGQQAYERAFSAVVAG